MASTDKKNYCYIQSILHIMVCTPENRHFQTTIS